MCREFFTQIVNFLLNFCFPAEYTDWVNQIRYSEQDVWWDELGTDTHTARWPARSEKGFESITGEQSSTGEEAWSSGEVAWGQAIVPSGGTQVGFQPTGSYSGVSLIVRHVQWYCVLNTCALEHKVIITKVCSILCMIWIIHENGFLAHLSFALSVVHLSVCPYICLCVR